MKRLTVCIYGVALGGLTYLLSSCGSGSSCNLCGSSSGTPELAVFAGEPRGPGNLDGTGSTVSFWTPSAVAIDGSGNVFVADTSNNTIRKIAPDGTVSTFAGTAGRPGHADGAGSAASFSGPMAVAVDHLGNVYVADTGNYTIRKISPDGVVSTLAGTPGVPGTTNGTGAAATFYYPTGIAIDSAGNVYVAQPIDRVIRRITPAGAVSQWAGTGASGSADGPGAVATFAWPLALATDSADNLFVVDPFGSLLRKISPDDVVTTLIGQNLSAEMDGPLGTAEFMMPAGIAADDVGNLFIADEVGSTIRKITTDGMVTTIAGVGNVPGDVDGAGSLARLGGPQGVAVDSAGNVYVADTGNNAIRKITPDAVVSTLAGPVIPPLKSGGLPGAECLAVAAAGGLYVGASGILYSVVSSGEASVLAGGYTSLWPVDGTGTQAVFGQLSSIVVNSDGSLYVSDWANHKIDPFPDSQSVIWSAIRYVTPKAQVTTLAGGPGMGSTDGLGSGASFDKPLGIASDISGNIYVADSDSDEIRRVTPAGQVTTLAGLAGSPGYADGVGAAARFSSPSGIAIDYENNIYVADTGNSIIRKLTPTGAVSTLAGSAGAVGSADGAGAAARFNHPRALAVDPSGNVYVADTQSSTVRKISPGGAVSTIVGAAGQAGFIPGALPGRIARPVGIAVSGASLYITSNNGVVVVHNVP
jgi:sugar lactone lactonase YvrE